MKRVPAFLFIAAALIGFRTGLHSQDETPAPAPVIVPIAPIPNGPPLDMLKAIKAANARLIEQQAATLLKLEEMEKTSETLKILGKRS